jgi:hypothetical protein
MEGNSLMHTHNDVNAFFIDGALPASSELVTSPHGQPEKLADLHTWTLFAHFLEPDKISRDEQKVALARITRSFIPVSVTVSAPVASQTMIGNPQLRPAAAPSQQLDGESRQAVYACGELALMRAVLADAIYCYRQRFLTKNWRTRRAGIEAVAWFADDDEHWPFSFINICRMLALEPDYLRRGLKRWRQEVTQITLDEQPRQTTSLRRPCRSAA